MVYIVQVPKCSSSNQYQVIKWLIALTRKTRLPINLKLPRALTARIEFIIDQALFLNEAKKIL